MAHVKGLKSLICARCANTTRNPDSSFLTPERRCQQPVAAIGRIQRGRNEELIPVLFQFPGNMVDGPGELPSPGQSMFFPGRGGSSPPTLHDPRTNETYRWLLDLEQRVQHSLRRADGPSRAPPSADQPRARRCEQPVAGQPRVSEDGLAPQIYAFSLVGATVVNLSSP